MALSSFGARPWRSKNIGNSDGLSNSAVNTIYMDSKGFVWFGTWDGLNRYDGSEVKVFKPNVFEKGSISNNIIRDIFEDKDKNLWIVTENGLNLYDYQTQSFTSYLTGIHSINYRENRFNAFLDSDSALWCNIYDYGLMRYDYQQKAFSDPVSVRDNPGIFKKSVGFYFTGDVLWALSENGRVYSLEGEREMSAKKTFNIPSGFGVDYARNWFVRSDGRHLLFLGLQDGGLIALNLMDGAIQEYMPNKSPFQVTALSESKGSAFLWGGTDDGHVFKLNARSGGITFLDEELSAFKNKQIKIWSIAETNPDLLWIGTDGDGVYRFILKNNFFSALSKGDLSQGALSHSIVRAVHENEAGDLWAGTRGKGLNYLPAGSSATTLYDTRNGLSNNAVLSLGEDKHNNIWIGTDSEGIDMLEHETGRFLHFPDDFVSGSSPDFGYVYTILFDSFGDLWIGTSGYGLLRMSIRKKDNGKYILGSSQQYQSETGKGTGLHSNIVYSISEGNPNVMWIGTRGSGLYRLNKLSGVFTHYNSNPEDLNSLSNDDVLSLWKSENQTLWIGTSGGLNRMDMTTSPYQFTHYTEKEGLPNNTIHAILEDNQKNIWVSTNKGLAKIDESGGHIRSYIKSDGLQNNEYTDGAACKGQHSGRFYFGGVDGVDMFYPEAIRDSEYFPRLAITGFSLLGPEQDSVSAVLPHNIDLMDSLVLKHNQNFFKFSFTTLNYHNKEKCRYAFTLENADNDFVLEDNGSEATFTNVPPGDYLFSINWTNENGIWHPESRRVHISILPPFWQTKWAYAIYALIFLFLLFMMGYAIKRRISARQRITVDRLEFEKIKEMNQYKFQFFTNIAHEFRTPLTLIMAPAAQLMDMKGEDNELSPYLKSIYNNSTRLLHLIRELIDFRKVETGNFNLTVKNDNFSRFLATVKGAFEQYAHQKSIRLKLVMPPENIFGWFDNRIMEKILLNLVSNAIKYSYDKGEVIIKLETEGEFVRVAVKDTGKGISQQYQNKIFDRFFQQTDSLPREKGRADSAGVGLSLTKSLTELHKGTIHLESIPGQGSCFTVSVPIGASFYSDTEKGTEMFIDETRIKDRAQEEFIGDDEVAYKEKTQPEKLAADHKECVLVVDDNEQIRNLISDILYPDFTIITAKHGKEGIEMISNYDVSVVVSDVLMPEMDGLQMCKTIKEDVVTCHIPVILLTAKGELEHRIEGIESGADSYIPKPFDPRHLKVRVKKLIEGRRRIQQSFQVASTDTKTHLAGLNSRDAKLMNNLQKFIERNIDNEEIGATALAAELYISKTQLYRKVKALTGFTPHGLIKNLRLKKAAEMLCNTDLTVSEIIYETGFKNRTYFYRSFKELYGDSPLDYSRKQ
jgi:signal transduction histidine kinase/ligand-binding sensor domain-containing protein/DNA-binding response OmpR family regulator